MEKKFKSGFIALIGRPNVGKSTLMNALVGQKVAIMSPKPQTTRNRIQSILTTEDKQVIFVDTPGIHKPKSKLGEYMNAAALFTFKEVDLIFWLIEPNDTIGAGDQFIIEKLKEAGTPVILLINKIDTVEKPFLLKVIDAYKDSYPFLEILPISALKQENTDRIMEIIDQHLEEGPQFFPDDMITDQPERQILSELIREKILKLLQEEIPHGVAVTIDSMDETEDGSQIIIDATIVCEKKSHKPIILGKGGSMIKQIGILSRRDIEGFLGMHVRLNLWVKIKENWRDSEFLMKNYGYRKGE
ncbi:GTPase Era [Clostridiales bacterium COT073_COT-073]|nr:GTPase Era [Clostridiales bacterium COT073_COT-073]